MRDLRQRYGDSYRKALRDESDHDRNDVYEQPADVDVVRMVLLQPGSPYYNYDDRDQSGQSGDDDDKTKDLAL